MKVFIPVEFGVETMFRRRGWEIAEKIQEADLIQFTGGADISPYWYNRPKHPSMYVNERRDFVEHQAWKYATEYDIPMAGICRGAQFLNVLCGGDMWQHVDNHGSQHIARNLRTGEDVIVSSCHHQCMQVTSSAEVVLVADRASFTKRMGRNGQEETMTSSFVDPQIEACFYMNRGVFCWQGHPEWQRDPSLYFSFLEEILK